jgi:excisionase family DNA binding protein
VPDVLTLREAAAYLRLSKRALYALARGRRVPAVRLGGKWLFPRCLLERWLAAQAGMPGQDHRLAPPPILAGSHALLLHLPAEAEPRLDHLGFLAEPAMAEDEVAAAVAEGRAEAGCGIRASAAARGLGFVPLLRERFDLVMDRREYFGPGMQRLLGFAAGAGFRARRIGGYDIAGCGTVAFDL